MEDCKHGLAPGTCSSCAEITSRGLLRQGRLPHRWVSIEAGYDSTCPACHGFVQTGEPIYKTHPDENFVCESCAAHELRRLIR